MAKEKKKFSKILSESIYTDSNTLMYVFLVLKCSGLVQWSWWFVFLPKLITWGVALVFMAIVGCVAMWAKPEEG